MNLKAFGNYITAIRNAIDAEENYHPDNSENTFRNNGKWALHTLEKYFEDREQNLRKWLNGKPCVFTSRKTGEKIEITIGDDLEAIYYFLIFCKKLYNREEVSEEFFDYLTYLIARSVCHVEGEGR